MKMKYMAGAALLASLAGSAGAQTIDLSNVRTASLQGLELAKHQPTQIVARKNQVVTRAVAHRGPDGKQHVKCLVEHTPSAANKTPAQTAPRRK